MLLKWRKKEKKKIDVSNETKTELPTNCDDLQELIIQVDMLPADMVYEKGTLTEISDRKVLAHINNLVPGLLQTGNATNNVINALKPVYQVIIPSGAKLAKSKAMEGAYRGIYHNATGIEGHANLVPIKKASFIATNTTSAVMSVGAMIVGQYYMTQIHNQISSINDNLTEISDFQNNEYRSKVLALITQAKSISIFQTEILENNELRDQKIGQLYILEQQCIELLGQASETIKGVSKKDNLNYKDYQKELQKIQSWFIYQRILLETLNNLCNLKYTLHLGSVSKKQCTALLQSYKKQVENAQVCLTKWHDDSKKRLNINIEKTRKKRDGIDGFVHWLPGLIKEEYNFQSLNKDIILMIENQSSGHGDMQEIDKSELYDKDVKIIAKDGKIYYTTL